MKIGKINRQSIAISAFTSVLNRYEKMPSELYIAGKLPDERIPAVAIIGSRKPTPYGEEVTYKLAYDLAKSGVVIISGLAYGIDAIAHKACLDAGGTAIAVVAQGLHRIYPASHVGLAERIIKSGGALISEYPEGTEAQKYHFLARNRLVSGLADAVLVTEAADRSGTFSTVAHAISQNKEVFAVPGPITSLVSVGPNRLLQQGAHVTLSAQDILEIVAPSYSTQQQALPFTTTALEQSIVDTIYMGVTNRDEIQATLKVSPQDLLQALTMLELNGTLTQLGGNRWCIK